MPQIVRDIRSGLGLMSQQEPSGEGLPDIGDEPIFRRRLTTALPDPGATVEHAATSTAAASGLVVNPSSVALKPGQTQQFAAFMDGQPVGGGVTWVTGSSTASNGVISKSGLYTAPQAGGQYSIHARYGSSQGQAYITVAVPAGASTWLKAQSNEQLYALWQALRVKINAGGATHGLDAMTVGTDESGQPLVVNTALVEAELQSRGAQGPVQKMEADQQTLLKATSTKALIATWTAMAAGKVAAFDAATGMRQDLIDFELRKRGIGPLMLGEDGKAHGPGIEEPPPVAAVSPALAASLAKASNKQLYSAWVAFKKGAPDPDAKTGLTLKAVEAEFTARKINPATLTQQSLTAGGKTSSLATSSSKLPFIIGGGMLAAVAAIVLIIKAKRKSNP